MNTHLIEIVKIKLQKVDTQSEMVVYLYDSEHRVVLYKIYFIVEFIEILV